MMEHIKNLLLGLVVIVLVIVGLYGIVWLLLNETFVFAFKAIATTLGILGFAYFIGALIRESRQERKEI